VDRRSGRADWPPGGLTPLRFRVGSAALRVVSPLIFALLLPGIAAAQQEEPPVDSTRIRQLQLLRDLDRGPGADSARIAADSARLAGPDRSFDRGGVPRSASDSIMAELLNLAGYSPTEYAGASAEYRASEGMLFLYGDSLSRAAFRGEGYESSTDSIVEYDQRSGELKMWGDVVSIPMDGDEVQSRYISCDVEDDACLAGGARTTFSEGGEWIVTGDLPEIRSDVYYGHEISFSSCELEVPHYHFEADQIKVVNGNLMVAKPVRLYFADVPVFWLPFIAQSLNTGRSSGILTPTFSVNDIVRTSGGYRRRISNVGFFWAINNYMDATVAMDWFDDNYTALTGSYRFLWTRQFLQGSLNFRRFWRAEGGRELTLNARTNWDLSERTNFRVAASYASSSSFVTDNSFNPQEVTQSIDSEGGVNHRFDWGTLAVNGNRRQFLSDDRVETTFPSATLSLRTVTLFPAPPSQAGIFNNLTWSGSANLSRSWVNRAESPVYVPGQEDRLNMRGGVNSSLNLGNLSLSGNLNYRAGTTQGLRNPILTGTIPQQIEERGMLAFDSREGQAWLRLQETDPDYGDPFDATQADLDWSSSINYQQRLVGSVTLTPRVSFAGQYRRIDTLAVAQDFVAGPVRTAFGATLRGDIYGFFPGFGGFSRIRHKLSPSFTYDWSPEVTSTELQSRVFGDRTSRPQNVISVTLNQTFEAKRDTQGDTARAVETEQSAAGVPGGEPARLPRAQVVNLLSLRTSAVRYDFVEAGDVGFLQGFQTTRLTNQISSDFLRGLSLSTTHDLFRDEPVLGTDGQPTGEADRTFDPQLVQMNLGFSLNGRSAIFRWLGFGGDDDPEEDEEEDRLEEDDIFGEDNDPLGYGEMDQASIVPGSRRSTAPVRSGGVGSWSANLSYALTRPRGDSGTRSQMIQSTIRFQPTQMWEMSWRTSFDLEAQAFNDHSIRLSRDLHRWRANFDFLQTATGNWSFRFEVSLIDNSDLKFDYQQRSLDRFSGN
jgi:hypothetical protein